MSEKAQADYGVLCCHCERRFWFKIDADKLWPPHLKDDVLRESGWKWDYTWPGGFVCPDCFAREQQAGQGDMNE